MARRIGRGRPGRLLALAALVPVAVVPASVAAAACGTDGRTPVVLVGTTSTYDSGLLERLVAAFEQDRPGYVTRVVAVGSREALALGRRGDADVLLVHAPADEEAFLSDGHGIERVPLMFNDFVLLGPPADPATVRGSSSVREALTAIAGREAPFLSRGDGSGTHIRERELWAEAGIVPSGGWYRETGQGQGNSLLVASERGAYMLADRATFVSMAAVLELEPLHEGDPALLNVYSVIRVTRAPRPEAAAVLAEWLTSAQGREVIGLFGIARHGRPLFEPLVVGANLPLGYGPAR